MRRLLICVLSLFALKSFSQVKQTVISDTSVIGIGVFEGDTSIFLALNFSGRECIAYYDSSFHWKAYHGIRTAYGYKSLDSSWYRNGQLMCVYDDRASDWMNCFSDSRWYPDGKVKMTYRCWGDSALEMDYYHSGQLKKKLTMAKAIGPSMSPLDQYEYYENGQIKYWPCPYDSINKFQQTAYYPSGKIWFVHNLWDLQRVGPYKEWYENGNLKTEGQYVEPEKHGYRTIKTGRWIYYDENGKLVKEEWYEDDKLVKTVNH